MLMTQFYLKTSRASLRSLTKFYFTVRQNKIDDILRKEFSPEYWEIINESHKHSVPKNSETHFKIIVVSDKFKGKTKIAIHREINEKLKEEFTSGLHALSILAFTSEEWSKNPKIPESENCRGGSKNKL